MTIRHPAVGIGAFVACIGVLVILTAALLLVAADMEERSCRAAKDGLDELSCMNFESIRFFELVWWGIGLLVVGLASAALAWRMPPPAKA